MEGGLHAGVLDSTRRHPLFENMSNLDTKYFIMRAPNMETLKLAIKNNEWALSKQAGSKIQAAAVKGGNIILFFSAVKSNTY